MQDIIGCDTGHHGVLMNELKCLARAVKVLCHDLSRYSCVLYSVCIPLLMTNIHAPDILPQAQSSQNDNHDTSLK